MTHRPLSYMVHEIEHNCVNKGRVRRYKLLWTCLMVEGASCYPHRVVFGGAPRTWLAVVVVTRTYAARVRAAACGVIGTSYVHDLLVAPLALHLLAEVIVLLVEIVNPRLQLQDSVPQCINVHRNMSFMGRIDPADKVAFHHLLERRVNMKALLAVT